MDSDSRRGHARTTARSPSRHTPPPHHCSEKLRSGGAAAARRFSPPSVMRWQPQSLRGQAECGVKRAG